MRKILLAVLAFAALLSTAPAQACSCGMYGGTHQQQVQRALNDAAAVLVVKIRHVNQFTDTNAEGWSPLTEDVQFVVLEVLKGRDDFRRGQPVATRSTISPGACGIPARNEPGWMMEISGDTEIPTRFSDTWLIYVYGAEPFSLSMCTRSLPLNIRNAQEDLETLRQLLDKVPPKRPRWEQAAFAER